MSLALKIKSFLQILMASLLMIVPSVNAEDVPATALELSGFEYSTIFSEPISDNSESFEIYLSKLMGDRQPRNLAGISDQLNISLPLPALWEPTAVDLHLRGVPSKTLINSSQLVIYLNDTVIAQYELGRGAEDFDYKINLPTTLLKPGFNRIQVRAIQHYTEVCEYPMAPQLWTQINLVESKFSIRAKPKKLAPSLNAFPHLFDRATWNEMEVVPVFMVSPVAEGQLAALGHVAQGIGHRYDFVPVRMSQEVLPARMADLDSKMPAGSRVAVVMGTFNDLRPFFDKPEFPVNAGPVVAVQALPNNPHRYVVFLLGKDAGEISSAASAFAIPGVPWPDSHWANINTIDIPTQTNLEKRFSIPTAAVGAFPLRALGFKTKTIEGMDAPSVNLKVWNNTWQGRMQVRVHMAYASGMSTQSALNVLTNGVMHGSIPMNNPNGGLYENYAVTIPAGAMKPGWNELEFKPVMIPLNQLNGGQCQPFFDGNLAMTIYEDTTVQKFGGDELRQIDLAAISGFGYLFTEKPLGKGIAFHLASKDKQTVSAAMTLVAKLTQIYNRPLLNATFGLGDVNKDDDHHFWIGAYSALPVSVKQLLNVNMPSSVMVPVPLIQSATVQVYEGGEWISNILEKLKIRRTPPQNFTEVKMSLSGEFSRNNFALSAKNKDDQPVIIFTATDANLLREGIDTIIDYGQWAQLRGMFSFWVPGGKEVYAVSTEDAPFSAYGLRGGLGLWVSQYPWTSLMVLITFILGMIAFTRRILKQYKNRNQQHDD